MDAKNIFLKNMQVLIVFSSPCFLDLTIHQEKMSPFCLTTPKNDFRHVRKFQDDCVLLLFDPSLSHVECLTLDILLGTVVHLEGSNITVFQFGKVSFQSCTKILDSVVSDVKANLFEPRILRNFF